MVSKEHEKYVKTCGMRGHEMHDKSMKMRPGSPRAASGAPGGSQNPKKWVHLQHVQGFVAPLGRPLWPRVARNGGPREAKWDRTSVKIDSKIDTETDA